MKPEPTYTLPLDRFDAATLALTRAVAILQCIDCAADLDNANHLPRPILQEALDGATSLVERARELLCERTPADAQVIQLPPRIH
jgi:hypothetical protein